MSQPTFTFVLPALNASGSLFERALSSIRTQDYPAELVEILVADGGSTDDTREVAERYGARVIENPNRLAEWGVKEGMLVAAGRDRASSSQRTTSSWAATGSRGSASGSSAILSLPPSSAGSSRGRTTRR